MSKKIMYERVGEISYNKLGSKMEIVNYIGATNVDVQFYDGFTVNTQYSSFINGTVSNPYDKTINGIGYLGEGTYKKFINRKQSQQYSVWKEMIRRCYNNKFQILQPSYIGCTVCDEWHNFQVFAKWFDENYYEIKKVKTELDKDILIKHNKIYSPETCVFVPQRINVLFTKNNAARGKYPIGVSYSKIYNKFIGTLKNEHSTQHTKMCETINDAFTFYKIHKEELVKSVAENYKSLIPEKLYKTLLNYQVEITD